jgi:hypothetical protein
MKVDFCYLNYGEEQLNKFMTDLNLMSIRSVKERTLVPPEGTTIEERTIHIFFKVRRGEIDQGHATRIIQEI